MAVSIACVKATIMAYWSKRKLPFLWRLAGKHREQSKCRKAVLILACFRQYLRGVKAYPWILGKVCLCVAGNHGFAPGSTKLRRKNNSSGYGESTKVWDGNKERLAESYDVHNEYCTYVVMLHQRYRKTPLHVMLLYLARLPLKDVLGLSSLGKLQWINPLIFWCTACM